MTVVRPPRLALALGIAGVVAIVLSVLAALDQNRIDDDAYMFVRYARNLVSDGRLAWNPGGPAVYGLTSLAYFGLVFVLNAVLRADPAIVLIASTVISGALFVAGAARLAWRSEPGATTGPRAWAMAFVLAGLTIAGPRFANHFVSGMDTAFSLVFVAFVLLAALTWEERPSARRAVVWGALGGATIWVRPDLLAFGAGVPMLVMLLTPDAGLRRDALRAAGAALGVAVVLALVAWLTLGSPLPLALYGKVLRGYGADMREVYAGMAGHQLALFARDYSPFLVVGAAGLVARLAAGGRRAATFDLALAIATLGFLGFHRFLVLPIMGDHQRFEYPALPGLIVLAVRGGHAIARVSALASQRRRWFAPVLGCVVLIAVGLAAGHAAKTFAAGPRFSNLRVPDHYRNGWPGRMWIHLDRVASLPDDVVLATTEVGLPGVMNPRKTIIDLAGLNDAEFARHGFSAQRLFSRTRPDLFYLTTRHYAEIRTSLLRDPVFVSDYEVLRPPSGLALALRRSGPHYTTIRTALAAP